MGMKVAILFSGGKDSNFTAYECLRKGYDVRYLVTMIPENPHSYMFHHPNVHLAELQARSMGIHLVVKETKGEKEKELADLKEAVSKVKNEVDGIVAGGLASKYQIDRVGRICQGFELKVITPIWGVNPEKYWRLLLTAGFEIIISSVSCEGLGKAWLGRRINMKVLEGLKIRSKKYGFNLAGEGGGFETLVTDSPVFRKKLIILDAEKIWKGDWGIYLVKDAVLCDKKRLTQLRKFYRKRKREIRSRLGNFRKLWLKSDRAVFAELCFCLCTPQSRAVSCDRAIGRMARTGVLFRGGRKEMEKGLKGVRFQRNKAGWILGARKLFTGKGRLVIKSRIDPDDIPGTRKWLVKNVKGLGYKEVSHFLRNIGLGQEIAILDRHIMRNLKRFGVIEDIPKSLTPKRYKETEDRMRRFAMAIGIPLEELDLLFWSLETGRVFK
jgi:ABC transporter with metal-binding/Fe-S-binding domain ATP-binding protein